MNTTSNLGSTKDAADALGVSAIRVRQLCQQGRMRGAQRIGDTWVIPLPPEVTLPKPDRRRPGVTEQADALPDFLAKRPPKGKP